MMGELDTERGDQPKIIKITCVGLPWVCVAFKQTLVMADFFTCHSRKSMGVFDYINEGCITLRGDPGIVHADSLA